MLGALTVAVAPAYIVRMAIDLTFGNRLYEWFQEVATANQAGLPPPPQPSDFGAAFMANVLGDVVLFMCSIVATAAVVTIVFRTYIGQPTGLRDGLREALARLMSLIGGQLLLIVAVLVVAMLGLMIAATFIVGGGLLTFLGLVALVGALAAILFIVIRATFTSVAIMTEHIGGADGFRRSWRIAADHGWRVLGYVVLVGLLGFLVTLLVALVPSLVNPLEAGSKADIIYTDVVTLVAAILAAPIAPIVLTLLYVELRWQHGERVPLPGGGEVEGRLAQPEP